MSYTDVSLENLKGFSTIYSYLCDFMTLYAFAVFYIISELLVLAEVWLAASMQLHTILQSL